MQSPQFLADEEFRQRVVRQALLLGFSAEEYSEEIITNHRTTPVTFASRPRWRFMFEGHMRTQYGSLYAAAFDYCRLMGLPNSIIGEYRG